MSELSYEIRTAFPQPEDYQAVKLFSEAGYQGSVICCPACEEYTGMECGDAVFAVGPDRDEYDSPAHTRGGWLETRGTCSSCGVGYTLVLANHKGMLTLSIAPLGEPWVDEHDDPYGDDDE